jgi:hypothetical protein
VAAAPSTDYPRVDGQTQESEPEKSLELHFPGDIDLTAIEAEAG